MCSTYIFIHLRIEVKYPVLDSEDCLCICVGGGEGQANMKGDNIIRFYFIFISMLGMELDYSESYLYGVLSTTK